MNRNKWLILLVAGWMASSATAQTIGLPVGRDAEPGLLGDTSVSGGLVLGNDFNMYGGRYAYNVLNEAFLFGDIGLLDPDDGSAGLGLQGGGQYTLPPIPELLLDLALRGSLGYANVNLDAGPVDVNVDFWTVTAGGVVSHRLDHIFSVYGFLGLAYTKVDGSARFEGGRVSASDSSTDPAFGAGVSIAPTQELSIYAELMYIDDPWFGIGARYQLW